MSTWANEAVRELETELNRLGLEAEAKRVEVERAQAAYDAVLAEQATVSQMLEWARLRAIQRSAESPAGAATADGASQPSAESPAPVALPVSELPAQTDLVVRALRQLGGEAESVAIRERLEQAGYAYDQTQVRSALKYLSRKKDSPVESLRPGLWRLRSMTVPYGPLESAQGTLPNGNGGSP